MRERDENAYIRFFALWFAAGMTLGVLLLLTASHTGMKEGNSVRLFQAEAFLGQKDLCKGLLFLPSEGAAGTGICRTSLWTDGDRRVFCHCCRVGHMVFCAASFSQPPICRTEWQGFYSFSWLSFRRFSFTLPRYF